MVTIYDISKITGYSPATVTRVINGSGMVSDETRERILSAAEITGFLTKKTPFERAIPTNKLIGVIVENESFTNGLEHPLFGGILNCFREQAEKNGFDLMYLSKRLNSKMNSYIDLCKLRNVDGILILNSIYEDPEVQKLAASGIPCVSSNEFIPGICTVVSENTAGAKKAVQYLIEKGHRKIGYIGGPFQIKSPASIERCEGYKQALKGAGIRMPASWIEKTEYWELDSGIKAAESLFTHNPDLTAVFCASDTIAAGAMQYLQHQGKHIPDDVSIIGFDDSLISACCVPPITTFRHDREKIAVTCAGKLIDAINGNNAYDIVRIPVQFIERESVRDISQ